MVVGGGGRGTKREGNISMTNQGWLRKMMQKCYGDMLVCSFLFIGIVEEIRRHVCLLSSLHWNWIPRSANKAGSCGCIVSDTEGCALRDGIMCPIPFLSVFCLGMESLVPLLGCRGHFQAGVKIAPVEVDILVAFWLDN